ncbi:DUF2185 domain-containing protein [Rathayibacter sp. VKM Ac-2927]|uniref:immunity protein Imm33 domain-containing protein n=1 Tax=Rathayibacter sp. VKM Ac-2927 TaxID=2929478 RepID=UPI0035AC2462
MADADTGWQFFSGDDSEEYLQDWSNLFVHSLNLVANCDPTIVPYLHLPRGTELLRTGATFTPTPASAQTERDLLS